MELRTAVPALLVTEWFPPVLGGSAELLFNIYSRLPPGHVGVLTAPLADRHAGSAETTLPTARMPFGAGIGLFAPADLGPRLRMARRIRQLTRVDSVIHCGRALPEGTAGMLARRRYVCWTHGEELPVAMHSRELAWLIKRVHRSSSALIANSRNTAKLLHDMGNAPEKVHVVYPGVDAARFMSDDSRLAGEAIRREYLRDGELMLLSVGRLQSRKGHDLVLKALASLENRASLRYVIVGEGTEAERLKTLTRELGLTDRVRFTGAVDQRVLPHFYAAADIFVHPNRVEGSDFEGFGIVFLEAAAAGIPAIGGRSGGVPEAIEEGVTGLLVSGTDATELQTAIRTLAESKPLRNRLGAAARARVLRDFTWDRAARQVSAIDDHARAVSR